MEFDKEKIILTVEKPMHLTEDDIDGIIVGAFEGGINYWGYLAPMPDKPKGEPSSQWATRKLLDGYFVHILDQEDENERWTLNLDMLKKGIQMNIQQRTRKYEDYDAEDYDCIIQYALFDSLVYG